MLRLRAFRPTPDKIVKIQVHPTQPWIVTADASDHVSVWNWEHRQVGLIPLCVICGAVMFPLKFLIRWLWIKDWFFMINVCVPGDL